MDHRRRRSGRPRGGAVGDAPGAGFSKAAGFDLVREAGLDLPATEVLKLPLGAAERRAIGRYPVDGGRWMVRSDAGPAAWFAEPGGTASADELASMVETVAERLSELAATDLRARARSR